MKKIFILSVLAIALIACKNDDDFVPELTVDQTSLPFEDVGGTKSFTITSNTNWTIVKNAGAEWITLSKESGNSNETIDVTVAENIVTAPRTAVITVKVDGLSGVEIEVNQSKALETVGLFILSEGYTGTANNTGIISYYDLKTQQVTTNYFSQANNGKSLGDGVNQLAMYGSKLYCVVTGGTVNTAEGYIEVINPETGVSIKHIPVEKEDGTNGSPRRIIFHEGKAYITTHSQSVVRLDTATLTIDARASISGTFTEGLCLYNDKLYVCNSGQGNGNTISIVSLSSFTETGTITVPQNPWLIEATSSGDIYFTTETVWDSWPPSVLSNLHLLNPEQKTVTSFNIRASKIALTKDFVYAIDFSYADYTDNINKINLQTKTVSDIVDIYEDYAMVYSVSANSLTGDIYLGNAGDNVVAFDKDGNEKFSLKTGKAYTLSVVPVIK